MSLPSRFLTIGEFKKLIEGLPDHVALGTVVKGQPCLAIDRWRIVQNKTTLKLGVIVGDKSLAELDSSTSFHDTYKVLSADKYYDYSCEDSAVTEPETGFTIFGD
jgi:hypothetical protein